MITPGALIAICTLGMFFAFAVGYTRYAVLCGPDDPFDIPDDVPWDTLDAIVFYTAIGSSCGIAFGCIWGLSAYLIRTFL